MYMFARYYLVLIHAHTCLGMKKYEYKGKQWHEECFCCAVCKQPIGNKSFIPRDQEVVCVGCYEENFAQRCMACAGVSKYSTSVCGFPVWRCCTR